MIPTFRPDRYLEPAQPGWREAVARLGEAAKIDTGDYPGYVRALEERRRYFIAHGATSADHSHADVRTDPLEPAEAARIYRAALAGGATDGEATAFRRHMLAEMARMSCDDGLVMTLHPGVRRNHHRPTFERFGPDTGHDIPIRTEFTDALRPLLERFGTHPGFHLVLFTVDETVWSRELAPLAGFYPSVYVGVPWWFLDAPDAIRRFFAAVTETAGLLADIGVRRRHPGVLLDPRPARHVAPDRRRLPRAAGRRAPARRGRGDRDRDRPRHRPPGRGVQAVSAPRLSRTAGQGRAAAPVRLVHLGLGNFFRAHPGWYTEQPPDAADWGIAAFTGRSRSPWSDELNEQDGLYTLVSRAADGRPVRGAGQPLAGPFGGRPTMRGCATSRLPSCPRSRSR